MAETHHHHQHETDHTPQASGFAALTVPNYRIYWVCQLISLIGTWMQTTAQAWLVLRLTESPLAIGIVVALQFAPVLLLSLVGGVIADRFSRFRLLMITQTIALCLAAGFAALVGFGIIALWQIYIIALMQGVVTAIETPVRQSFISDLVSRERRASAVALGSVLFNTARILGPALAGFLIGPIGIAAILAINAASFLVVLGGMLLMNRRAIATVPPASKEPVLEGLRASAAFARRTPVVLLVLIVMAAIGTFGYNFTVIMPLVGEFLLRTDAAGFGLLSAFFGAGSLVGALTAAAIGKPTPTRLLVAGGLFCLLLGALALSESYAVSAILLIVLGCAGVTFTTSCNTLIQLNTPDELRGRVISFYLLLFMGTTPIGGLLLGGLARVAGVGPALLVCAALCAVGVIGGAAYWARRAPRPELVAGVGD